MAWTDAGWKQHLTLAEKSRRYMSMSRCIFRAYWLQDGRTFILNEETGVAREVSLTKETENKLLFGAEPNDKLLEQLFNLGAGA